MKNIREDLWHCPFLLTLISVFFSNNLIASTKSTVPQIRVLLGSSLKSIVVSGMDLKRSLLLEGNTKQHMGLKSVKFNCEFGNGNRLSRQKQSFLKSSLLAHVSSPTGIVSWNKTPYRGELYIAVPEELKGRQLINQISLENYLVSLLAKEMNGSWALEALKAQAIAARTYALFQMEKRQASLKYGKKSFYDLENSERDQVNGSVVDETTSTAKATGMTSGEVLVTKTGHFTPIFFHSKCGGRTLLPANVWDKKVEGYQSVPCPYCKGHGNDSWKYHISKNEFQKLLLKSFPHLNGNGFDPTFSSVLLHPDRYENLKVKITQNGKLDYLNKIYLRRFLGRSKVKSNNFYMVQKGEDIVVHGEGLGHGVGMCQFGALALADKGWSYKKILAHYFPNHKIKSMY